MKQLNIRKLKEKLLEKNLNNVRLVKKLYYENKNKSVLVLCPKKTRPFEKDRSKPPPAYILSMPDRAPI